MEQLDIRRIIANSISLQDFIRCFLTKPQQALLTHQRTRMGALNTDGEESSPEEADADPLGNFPSATFVEDLTSF